MSKLTHVLRCLCYDFVLLLQLCREQLLADSKDGCAHTLAHTAIPIIYFHQFYNCEIYFLVMQTYLPILQSPSFSSTICFLVMNPHLPILQSPSFIYHFVFICVFFFGHKHTLVNTAIPIIYSSFFYFEIFFLVMNTH